MGWSSVDEINGAARLVPFDPVPWPVSRLWMWLIAAVGVLVIVVGAVLFSPATHSASAAAVSIPAHLTAV
jgi:hypothetical protein